MDVSYFSRLTAVNDNSLLACRTLCPSISQCASWLLRHRLTTMFCPDRNKNSPRCVKMHLIKKYLHLISFSFMGLFVWVGCTLRHGGHVGDKEQYDFSPLGVNLYFYANYVNKFFFCFGTNIAAMQSTYTEYCHLCFLIL